MTKKNKVKSYLILAVKIVISFGILGWLVFHKILPKEQELRTISDTLRALDAGTVAVWIAGALLVQLTGMCFTIIRWRLLLRGQGLEIGWWHAVGSFLIGRFIGSFSPGTTGLDGWRMYDVARHSKRIASSVSVIVVEKIIGFLVLSVLLMAMLPYGGTFFEDNQAAQEAYRKYVELFMLGAGVPFLACFIVLLKPGWIGRIARRFLPEGSRLARPVLRVVESVTTYENHRGDLLKAVLSGFPVHIAICTMYWFTAHALGVQVSYADIMFVAPIMIAATVVPASIAGIGVREGVFVAFLGPLHGAGIVALFAFMGYLVGEVISLFGGPIWLARRSDYEMFRKVHDAEHPGAAVGPGSGNEPAEFRGMPDGSSCRGAA